MKIKLLFIGLLLFFISCSQKNEDQLLGTWKLLSSETIRTNTTVVDTLPGQIMLKIINETHFSFLRHDLDSNQVFVAGGGTYNLTDDKYTENLDFCNYREWENHKFDFNIKITNDTLVQKGVEELEEIGIKQTIIETYVKVK